MQATFSICAGKASARHVVIPASLHGIDAKAHLYTNDVIAALRAF